MDKFVKLGLVAVMLVAVTSVASAGLQLSLTFEEQEEEVLSDLWTFTVTAPAGNNNETLSLETLIIDIGPVENAQGHKYFDLQDGDGIGLDSGDFTWLSSSISAPNLSTETTDTDDFGTVPTKLLLDFAGLTMESGDGFSFTADLDNHDKLVWGSVLSEYGAYMEVTYDNGRKATGYFSNDDGNVLTATANVTVAPLPGSLLLCGIGLGFMGVVRRFRRK